MTDHTVFDTATTGLAAGTWKLDPARSSVEFHVRHFYGLMTVHGRFERYHGTLEVSGEPAVSLVIDADSLTTGNTRRDKHLRSKDFFDVTTHPTVTFEAPTAKLDPGTLEVQGSLTAAGHSVPVDIRATVTATDGAFEIEATAPVDHRKLGMTWSPLGIMRAPSTLTVHGRLVQAGAAR